MVPNMKEHSQIATKGMDENILVYCGSIHVTQLISSCGGGRKHLATCILVSSRNARRLGRWFFQLLINPIQDVRKRLDKGSLPG
jgi:hypothetical protein